MFEIFKGPESIEESNAPWTNPISEDFHILVFEDKFPVSPGHLLFVPKYNSTMLLNQAFEDAVNTGIKNVNEGKWEGFNIGLNYGTVAGQTVNWPHVHLIPRFSNDVDDPVGGVRNVIPGKGNYKNEKANHR